jgi:hypothetical protein
VDGVGIELQHRRGLVLGETCLEGLHRDVLAVDESAGVAPEPEPVELPVDRARLAVRRNVTALGPTAWPERSEPPLEKILSAPSRSFGRRI